MVEQNDRTKQEAYTGIIMSLVLITEEIYALQPCSIFTTCDIRKCKFHNFVLQIHGNN